MARAAAAIVSVMLAVVFGLITLIRMVRLQTWFVEGWQRAAAPSGHSPSSRLARLSAMTSVALYKSSSGSRSSARCAFASSMLCGPAP